MATVIKSNSLHEPPSGKALRTIAFRFDDIADEANEYLDTVREEAAKIIQQAHQKAERIRQEATASGRQAAMDAAHQVLDEKVARQMDTLLPALETAIRGIEDARHEWLAHWERSVVSLAAAIASRVIRRELTAAPEIAIELIRDALSLAAGADELTLHLNPIDHANLGPQVERLAAATAQLAPTDIVADESVDLGGCRVVTSFGEVDQRIEAQLKRIVEELTG
jgi:flagellar assembly protein FliH